MRSGFVSGGPPIGIATTPTCGIGERRGGMRRGNFHNETRLNKLYETVGVLAGSMDALTIRLTALEKRVLWMEAPFENPVETYSDRIKALERRIEALWSPNYLS